MGNTPTTADRGPSDSDDEGDIRSRDHSTGQRPAHNDTGASDSEPGNELAEGATELNNGKEPHGDTNRKSHFVDRAPRPPEPYMHVYTGLCVLRLLLLHALLF